MKIEQVPFEVMYWGNIPRTEHAGETGIAYWQTRELGNVRIRKVEYSPGYMADHWCSRGHVLLVLEGELTTELKDGRAFVLRAGDSYHTESGTFPHRSVTARGAKLFIVD